MTCIWAPQEGACLRPIGAAPCHKPWLACVHPGPAFVCQLTACVCLSVRLQVVGCCPLEKLPSRVLPSRKIVNTPSERPFAQCALQTSRPLSSLAAADVPSSMAQFVTTRLFDEYSSSFPALLFLAEPFIVTLFSFLPPVISYDVRCVCLRESSALCVSCSSVQVSGGGRWLPGHAVSTRP